MSGTSRIDRILATETPGGALREDVLADEVRRLRAALDAAEMDAEMVAIDVEKRIALARIGGALEAGGRVFGCASRAEHYALVSPSARPDCPPGHWQVTRFDAEGPMGHTYAAAPDGIAAELYNLGFLVPRRAAGGAL